MNELDWARGKELEAKRVAVKSMEYQDDENEKSKTQKKLEDIERIWDFS